MSLTTLLVAFLPAAIAPRVEPNAREAELERENQCLRRRITQLLAERDDAEARCDALTWETTRSREAVRLPADVQRANEMLNRIVAEQVAQQQNALVQAAYYEQAMSVQNAQNAQAFSQLGWRDCTCVPARHDALLGLAGL